MKSFVSHKVLRLTLAFSTLIGLTILAAGVRDLKFDAGRPFRLENLTENLEKPTELIIDQVSNIPVPQFLLFWLGLIIISILVSLILSPEIRKLLLRMIVRSFLFVAAIYYIIKNNREALLNLVHWQNGGKFTPLAASQIPASSFPPPQIPPALSFFISLLVIVVVTAPLIWYFFGKYVNLSRGQQDASNKDMARMSRASITALDEGRQWTDVVIECYSYMSHILDEKRGLHRKQTMTPAEFAFYLKDSGLPADPILRLTRLFEVARYGEFESSAREIREARACLTDILRACEETL